MYLEKILNDAIEKKASDIHISCGLPPVIRLFSKLMPLSDEVITREMCQKFLPILLNEEQKAYFLEKGEIDVPFSLDDMNRFRLNIYKNKGDYSYAFRYINNNILSFSSLGLPESIENVCKMNAGLVLITGATGMGKTTTLASIIDWINTNRDVHVVTLEEPIEYMHTHKKSIVNQREIGPDSKTYLSGLKAVLRQDPDVILIGEMRDHESISIALTAAETGHLVFSTLHTNGAAKTIDRIIDVFPPFQQQQIRIQLSIVLKYVISQQLVPRIDNNSLALAYEVMMCNPAISNLIRESKTHQISNVIRTSFKSGMITMDKSLINLYKNGAISRETALMYCLDKEQILKEIDI